MKSNWLYDQSAHSIVVVLMAAMLVAFELAYRAGRRWHADTHDAGREVFVAIKVSLLGLLALLLAFAFRDGGGSLRRAAAIGDERGEHAADRLLL